MAGQVQKDIALFFAVGINYKKTDAALRGRFAIGPEQYANILALAPSFNLHQLFVLSTCNRTEIYGFAENPAQLCRLLCTQTEGSAADFEQLAYIKKGAAAIHHLFEVAAGLDAQILGDYEILGQLKLAVTFARERGYIGVYLDRMTAAVLQASKLIKTNTALSGGTVSVSFAAIQYIKENVPDIAGKKIVLAGTGKIGRITCKNLVDYLQTKNITLINRTESKAAVLAKELGLQYAPLESLKQAVVNADIIIVSTNSIEPVILKSHVSGRGNKVIIDLSIPYNVETAAQELDNITFVNVDSLSKIKDATLHKRAAEVPKAKAIIEEHVLEFLAWCSMRKNVPALKAIKNKLQAMRDCNLYISYIARQNEPLHNATGTATKIQKVVNGTAIKMRSQNRRGCSYIDAINEFIATGTN